jgi:hypothetical protein
MKMIYTSNDKLPLIEKENKSIFLAGSIDRNMSSNWRKMARVKLAHYDYLFDPTNPNHDNLDDKEMKEHIEWELNALLIADKILLNFTANALSPISLVELGLYVATDKLIVVCPKEFYKSRYVHTLCEKYNTPFFYEIEEALNILT